MKKRIFAFIGVLVIVASVFVLPMSAINPDYNCGSMVVDGYMPLTTVSAVYTQGAFWLDSYYLEYAKEYSILRFSRNRLTDPAMGEEETGIYRRALQASKVLIVFTADDTLQGERILISCPTFDMSWYDGADDPHFRIKVTGAPGTWGSGANTYDILECVIRCPYSADYDIVFTATNTATGNTFTTDYQAGFFEIFLMDYSSIQDLSFNRMFNLIGGFSISSPKIGFGDQQEIYNQGFEEGKKAGVVQGWAEGKEQGIEIGREEGIEIGKEEGIVIGREEGEEIGYKEGYAEAVKTLDTSGAWANFKDLIFAIFDAPFYVISQALSFEVFGINIASTIIGLISTALIVWILKIIIVKLF